MLTINNKLWGFVLGILTPIAALGFLLFVNEMLIESDIMMKVFGVDFYGFKDRTLFVIAVVFNVFLFNHFKSKRLNETMTGMLFGTMVYAVLFMIWYYIDKDFSPIYYLRNL